MLAILMELAEFSTVVDSLFQYYSVFQAGQFASLNIIPPSKDLPLILLLQDRMWLVHPSLQQGKNQHPQWLPLQLLF